MLKIRFSKIGRKHEPVYRLVLTDSKNAAKSGKFNEILGNYDSRRAESAQFDGEKINYWMSKGAKLSDTANNLLVKMGVIKGEKKNVLPKSVIEKARAPKEVPAAVSDEPKEEAAPAPVAVEEPMAENIASDKIEPEVEQAA